MHEFVAMSFDAVVSADAMESGEFVVVIVERLSPVFGRFARLDETSERNALHIVGDFDSAHIKESRCEVDVLG